MKMKYKKDPKESNSNSGICRRAHRFFLRLHSLQAMRTPSNPEVPG